MPHRAVVVLLATLALPLGAAGADTISASSDDCLTQLAIVWGPHVDGACSAAFTAGVSVSCSATCTLTVSSSATGTSAAPTGAGVFAWVASGNVQPCPQTLSLFAQGAPPCATSYAYPCSAVIELAGAVSCSGTSTIVLSTPPDGCTSFVLGATGHGRMRAPPSPSPPPFTVLVPYSAFAMSEHSLVRATDGTPTIANGLC